MNDAGMQYEQLVIRSKLDRESIKISTNRRHVDLVFEATGRVTVWQPEIKRDFEDWSLFALRSSNSSNRAISTIVHILFHGY